MANLIGKIRIRTHDWLEGRGKAAQEQRDHGIQKKEANRIASGFYELHWDWPPGKQSRSVANDMGVVLLKRLLASMGARDVVVTPVVLQKANKTKGIAARMQYDFSWQWPSVIGKAVIGNEVTLLLQKQKLKMAGATNIRSEFIRPDSGTKAPVEARPPVRVATTAASSRKVVKHRTSSHKARLSR
jgi:hypothetical protein